MKLLTPSVPSWRL